MRGSRPEARGRKTRDPDTRDSGLETRATVLVTGASGFIGGAITRRLVGESRRVRGMVRSPDAAAAVRAVGAEAVLGDVTEPGSLAGAVSGCRVVFHAAGLNGVCLRDPGRLDRVNVAGTVNLIRACATAGVERVVYTSSAAAVGEPRGAVGSEATEHRGRYLSAYERSKHRAEQAAFSEAERLGIDLVAVNPSSVQGPGRATGSARLLLLALGSGIRPAVRTRVSLVSIADCVTAHLLAETRGMPGERYLVSGWTATVGEVIAVLEEVAGRPVRVRWIPRWLVLPAAAVVGAVWALAGRDAPICLEAARTILHGHAVDGSKAERDLRLTYTPPEVWLTETVTWFREQGLVE